MIFILTVFPSVDISLHNTTVTQGTNVTLNCTATGYPQPAVTWTYNGGPVLTRHGQSEERLTLTVVQKSDDEGNYTCSAKNFAGETHETVKLTVYGKVFF